MITIKILRDQLFTAANTLSDLSYELTFKMKMGHRIEDMREIGNQERYDAILEVRDEIRAIRVRMDALRAKLLDLQA